MYREYKADTDIPFTWSFFSGGVKVVPDSAYISITDCNGASVISSTSADIADDGTVSYTLASAKAKIGKNYRIDIKYTVNGVDNFVSYLYDVVHCPLRNVISDGDLFLYVGELRDKVKERTAETSANGDVNYLISSSLIADNRDYTGGYIDIYMPQSNDTTIIHQARVVSYVSSSGKVTFAPSYSSAIGAQTVFSIRPSFSQYIDNAFNSHVIRDVRNRVGIAAGYIDSTVVSSLTIFKTLELYCFSQIEEDGDKWSIRYKFFASQYAEELEKLREPFDKDEDGNIADNDVSVSFGQIGIMR